MINPIADFFFPGNPTTPREFDRLHSFREGFRAGAIVAAAAMLVAGWLLEMVTT